MGPVSIGIVGDFDAASSSHAATNDALAAAGRALGAAVAAVWVPTEAVAAGEADLVRFDGLWAAPGSPYRSIDGALDAIRFARERDRPFFAT
jgi:CTP synthase (UTP-ammonia lyase)